MDSKRKANSAAASDSDDRSSKRRKVSVRKLPFTHGSASTLGSYSSS